MTKMKVGLLTLHLQVAGSHSLKDKRRILKSLTARLRRDFNVSVAEIDDNDRWQSAILGIACVANDADYAQGVLLSVVKVVENGRLDAQILDYQIELV